MLKGRYLTNSVLEDLREKMVFIGGPRQVGKTTFARKILSPHFKKSAYFNWDNRPDRRRIMSSEWPGDAEILLFDEIHKYGKWKSILKGEYDNLKEKYKFLVTGSGRMDVFRRGGDSLQGRYHYYRMHPFTLPELINKNLSVKLLDEPEFNDKFYESEFKNLMKFGGFPEPLFKQSEKVLRRWQNEKIERLFREDIRDTGQVRDLNSMKVMSDMLPDRVGSPLSVNSMREDLEVSHRAVSSWLDILESHYYCFRIFPFTGNVIRSIKKRPKVYLWDWSEVSEDGKKFENLIASHLLKWSHFIYDSEGYNIGLFYLRDSEKREVDFVVTMNMKPWIAVEVKLNKKEVSSSLYYYKKKLNIPYVYQVVADEEVDILKNGIRIISASRFLSSLI